MRGARLLAVLLVLHACARSTAPPPPSADSPRVQAALATVTVENRTSHEVAIAFRAAGRERGRITIGSVPPGATRRLAPVPAAEPIVLQARTAAGGTTELAARTFAVDEQWLWILPAETVFR